MRNNMSWRRFGMRAPSRSIVRNSSMLSWLSGTTSCSRMNGFSTKLLMPLINHTLPHQLIGEYGAGRVLVKPASEGTGVIAGGAVRAVMQAVGVRDVRTKVLGSTNPHNVVRATFDALLRMKDPMELARLRGKQVEEM